MMSSISYRLQGAVSNKTMSFYQQQRRSYMDVHQRPSHSGMFRRDGTVGPVEPVEPSPPSQPLSDFDFYRTLLFRILSACTSVYCLTEYVADITLTEGPSMTPTIRSSGEIILVDKFHPRAVKDGMDATQRTLAAVQRQKAHGTAFWHQPQVSVSDLPRPSYREWFQQIQSPLQQGDVVVVQHPHRRGTVCKRVAGLPGDKIILYRPTRFPTLLVASSASALSAQQQQNQAQPQQIVTVPTGCVWLEGDNPNNSADSRNYGPVPAALIQGRVLARIWPLRGEAAMVRGGRPRFVASDSSSNINIRRAEQDSGSTVLPAGYQGQHIVKHVPSPPLDTNL
jgi:signal peptidase I